MNFSTTNKADEKLLNRNSTRSKNWQIIKERNRLFFDTILALAVWILAKKYRNLQHPLLVHRL